jgi:hypothetical protein
MLTFKQHKQLLDSLYFLESFLKLFEFITFSNSLSYSRVIFKKYLNDFPTLSLRINRCLNYLLWLQVWFILDLYHCLIILYFLWWVLLMLCVIICCLIIRCQPSIFLILFIFLLSILFDLFSFILLPRSTGIFMLIRLFLDHKSLR